MRWETEGRWVREVAAQYRHSMKELLNDECHCVIMSWSVWEPRQVNQDQHLLSIGVPSNENDI